MAYITSAERIGMQKGLEQGIQQGLQQGMQQGMQQGRLEERKEIAKKLHQQGLPLANISLATDFSIEELQSLLIEKGTSH